MRDVSVVGFLLVGIIIGALLGAWFVPPKPKLVTQTKIQVRTKTNIRYHSLSSGDTLVQAEQSFSPKKFVGKPVTQVIAGTKFTCLYYINKTNKVSATSEDWYGSFCINSKLVS